MKKKLGQPKPQTPGYPYRRLAEEAAVIKHCKELGGVELKPPRDTAGFSPPEPR